MTTLSDESGRVVTIRSRAVFWREYCEVLKSEIKMVVCCLLLKPIGIGWNNVVAIIARIAGFTSLGGFDDVIHLPGCDVI